MRLLIVDDHEIMRKGLVSVFEMEDDCEVVGQACSAEDGLEMIEAARPDVVLMDIRMPGMGGVKGAACIKSRHPDIRVVVLTAIEDDEEVFEAIETGISGYLLKDTSSEELTRAIRAVAAGESYLHPQIARKVMERIGSNPPDVQTPAQVLTSREMRVLQLMAKGYKNREIADQLFLSEETVKSHVSNILNKLNQTDRMQAVFFAVRQGILRFEKTD